MALLSDQIFSKRVNESLNSVGSFWSENVANREQVFSLVDACFKTTLFSQFENGLKQLLNRQDFFISNVVLEYDERDVNYSGNTLSGGAHSDESPEVYLHDDPSKLDEGASHTWWIPLKAIKITHGLDPNVKEVVKPIRILAAKKEIVLNSDFYINNDCLQFVEDPKKLFRRSKMLITTGVLDSPSIYRFPLKIDSLRDSNAIVRFSRVNQSPHNFKIAIAELAGQKYLKHTQRLLHITEVDSTVTYTFEKEVITTDYPHERLVVDTLYNKEHIVGDNIQLATPSTYNKRWWRDVDLHGGLALGTLTGDPGILVPDDIVMAYIADSDEDSLNGSKAHVRLNLTGTPDLQDAYWERVAQRETLLGKYLNDVVGIGHDGADDPDFDDANFEGIFQRLEALYAKINDFNKLYSLPKEFRNVKRLRDHDLIDPNNGNATPGIAYVNAIDTFFESILESKAMIITINISGVSNISEVIKFVDNEKPVGCIPIILLVGDRILDSFAPMEKITASYNTFPIVSAPQEEVVNLSSIIVDSYSVN
jgi:hypothetical protein